MGEKRRFNYESVEDVESIIKYLEAVRQGFLDGSMSFSHEDRNILLEPQGLLDFTLEAASKGKAHSLKLKIKWKDSFPGDERRPLPLSIESGNGKM